MISKRVEIYVASHKKVHLPQLPREYILIHGGADITNIDSDEIGDNSGENISIKNPMYNELTVIYWAWKNRRADIKGLCHYRRFFSSKRVNISSKYFLGEKQILRVLNHYDIILQEKSHYGKCSVAEGYCKENAGTLQDIDIVRNSIQRKCPDYLNTYDEIMNGYRLSYYNMFICKSNIFDQYCEWLFEILEDVERTHDINNRNGSQKRMLAFMAERLLNVWVSYQKLNVKYYPVVKIDQDMTFIYYIKVILEKVGAYQLYRRVKFYYESKVYS